MNEFLELMKEVAQRGGEIALSMMADSRPSLKPDQSVLTEADLAVTRLVREYLRDYLKKGHILIDEESPESKALFDEKTFRDASYIWSVDPIDGTRSYANRMPFFGVSIGLLKDFRPWLGVVYMPALGELYYADGEKAYLVRSPFTAREETIEIVPVEQPITQQSVFFGSDSLFKNFYWDYSLCQVMLPACAVIDLCWPATGRACGCIFDAHIWDLAGSWPVFRAAGLDLRSLSSGEVLDHLEIGHFQNKDARLWRMKEVYVLSSARNFPALQAAIRKKI